MRVKELSQRFNKKLFTWLWIWWSMIILEHVDRDAITVANVNARYGLLLKRFRTLEYYAKAIDKAMQEKPDLFVSVDDAVKSWRWSLMPIRA